MSAYDGLVKFTDYSELKKLVANHEDVVILNMKDGSKYYLTDTKALSKYSNNPNLESFMFFYDENSDAADAGTGQDAGTVATVGVSPRYEPAPKKAPDAIGSTTMVAAILAGTVGSAGGSMLANMVKKALRDKDKKDDGTTDCKTHQIAAKQQFFSLSQRIEQLEKKPTITLNEDEIDSLAERIGKLEKAVKTSKKK